jgi:hypothetical protein
MKLFAGSRGTGKWGLENNAKAVALPSLVAKPELLSQDDMRAALRVAGKKICKLNFGRADTPVLKLLRRVLREARAVAAAEKGRADNRRCQLRCGQA